MLVQKQRLPKKVALWVAVFLMVLGIALPTPLAARPLSATASDLRSALTALLGEHVLLAASASGAALGGRQDEFAAAAAALDGNSVDLAKAIGSVYGAEAESAFLELWREHIDYVVDYVTGLATDDQAMSDTAVQNLIDYTPAFGAALSSLNPTLPADAVAELILDHHILTLKGVIDWQAEGDPVAAYTALRSSYAHMDSISVILAGGIAAQEAEMFTGVVDSPAANLRTGLTVLLQEHTFLAAAATDAALGGRQDEFEAAAAALDGNSVDVAAAIGAVYGAEAESAFLELWRAHIGFVVDYTVGLATEDTAKSEAAVQALVDYAPTFGEVLNALDPALPADVVSELVLDHILTLKEVIDAQATGDPVVAYTALRTAYGHMPMIADPLAAAIAAQFPDQFGEEMVAAEAMDHSAMTTEEEATDGEATKEAATEAASAEMAGEDEAPTMLPVTGSTPTTSWGSYAAIFAVLLVGVLWLLSGRQRNHSV